VADDPAGECGVRNTCDSGLAAGQFVIGTIVQDASDRIIYTSATGAGGTVAIQFADMTPVLALTNLERARSKVLGKSVRVSG
jgi:hypothetical protein